MHENLDELCAWAEKFARQAGAVMRQYFAYADKGVETKKDHTPVTIADKKINDLLIERVTQDFPQHGVLGEEASYHPERNQLWVCDPIDGTKGFILGLPTAMFSLAFVVDGQPEAAVMYDPFLDRLFSAVTGKGAYCNGQPVHVSQKQSLRGAEVGTITSYRAILKRKAVHDALDAAGADLLFTHGNVFKGSLVAQGSIDGYIFPGRSAHDIAAEKLIIEEAGGRVTDLDGHEQRYDGKIRGVIISNGYIHDELVRAVAAYGTERYLGY